MARISSFTGMGMASPSKSARRGAVKMRGFAL
ncbi:hypothetical protein LTSEWAN_1883, partial [Salmonella enterica subsp. enterica serovar Wandsworth str. A4-580]